jgi:hypothetical protein
MEHLNLLFLLGALIVVCILLWGIERILAAFAVEDPWATVIWVVAVVIAALSLVQAAGLYHFI